MLGSLLLQEVSIKQGPGIRECAQSQVPKSQFSMELVWKHHQRGQNQECHLQISHLLGSLMDGSQMGFNLQQQSQPWVNYN